VAAYNWRRQQKIGPDNTFLPPSLSKIRALPFRILNFGVIFFFLLP
jgi:hypothetical protein